MAARGEAGQRACSDAQSDYFVLNFWTFDHLITKLAWCPIALQEFFHAGCRFTRKKDEHG